MLSGTPIAFAPQKNKSARADQMSVNEGQRTKALQIRQMRRLRLDNVQITGGATKATIDILTPEVASDVLTAIK
jgi:hypothetical protein